MIHLLAETVSDNRAWQLTTLVVNALLVVGLGGVAHFLRKTLNHFNERIARNEEHSRTAQIDSVVADGRIKENLARGYVPRDECRQARTEIRDTTTRIFTKIEDLQQGQSRAEGKIDTLTALVKENGGSR